MKNKSNTFSQKEISTAINNAVVFAKAPTKVGEIEDRRLQRLREYAMALIEPLNEEIFEMYMKPEEAVLILLTAALYLQCTQVMNTEKLPEYGTAKALYKKSECPICAEKSVIEEKYEK